MTEDVKPRNTKEMTIDTARGERLENRKIKSIRMGPMASPSHIYWANPQMTLLEPREDELACCPLSLSLKTNILALVGLLPDPSPPLGNPNNASGGYLIEESKLMDLLMFRFIVVLGVAKGDCRLRLMEAFSSLNGSAEMEEKVIDTGPCGTSEGGRRWPRDGQRLRPAEEGGVLTMTVGRTWGSKGGIVGDEG